ncbi:MAG: AIR synthase [Firmicutes bacterium]|mgnify:CR=1 FL=1|nr:AIR synthase [Bacillota bacterium]
MKVGKIPSHILQKTVLPLTGSRRTEVLVGPKFGEDCAVLDLGDNLVVLSTDPITGATKDLGRLAVHISCNDVAATGAEPVGLLFSILLPPGTDKKTLRELVQEIHHTATGLGVAVLGGHTEITPVVNQVVINSTALGKVTGENLVTSSGAQPGDDVILTKTAGLEGTAILAQELAPYLSPLLPSALLEDARALAENLSVVPEGITAAQAGATALHDVTEGGLKGALVEIAAASGVGVEVWERDIPLAPATEAICHQLKIDPLGLISSGAMLITAPPGGRVLAALTKAGIPAHIIGKVCQEPELIIRGENGPKKIITAPERDELYRALEKYR